jgi:L-arginine-specific L-amino acid ligase
MKKKHALLINSDKMEPIHILKERKDIDLSVITKPKYAALYEGFSRIYPVNDVADLTGVRSAALSAVKPGEIHGVITPIERSLIGGGLVRSALNIQGVGFENSLNFADKYIMKSRLAEAGVPTADFLPVHDPEKDIPCCGDRIGWPIVVKPAVSSGSMNSFVIQSEKHYRELKAEKKLDPLFSLGVTVLAESFVDVKAEYHYDAVIYKNEVLFRSASQYIVPLLQTIGDGFGGSYTLSADNPILDELDRLHREAIKTLGLTSGVTHLELFHTTEGVIIGEITCRPAGGGILPVILEKYGVDYWEAYIDVCMNAQPDINVQEKPGVFGWCGLPARNGKIIKVTPYDVFREMEGVYHVKTYYRPGDIVDEKITCVFNNAVVFFNTPTHEDADRLYRKIMDTYRLRVDET